MNTHHSLPGLILHHGTHGPVCLIGSGGKSTLMYALARHLFAQGKRTLCSTTTKLFAPVKEQSPFLGVFANPSTAPLPPSPFLVTLASAWLPLQPMSSRLHPTVPHKPHAPLLAQSIPTPDADVCHKIDGYSVEALDALWASGTTDFLLVEADGAAGRQLKAPEQHEPVIPETACAVIAVVGLAGIGKKLDEQTVWRTARFAALSGLTEGSVITPEALARVVCHHEGLFRNCPAHCSKLLFLNTQGLPSLLSTGAAVAQAIGTAARTLPLTLYTGAAATPENALCLFQA